MAEPRLPIGIQTFRKVREQNCYYVDKTAYIRRLLDTGTHYFLSRPRRFGKSLFLDTLKELFEGSEALFEGLEIHDHWNWSERFPVVRLDFDSGYYLDPTGLYEDVMAQLEDLAEEAGFAPRYDSAPVRFRHLIRTLSRQAGRPVVVLVDEYDKPILDALEQPELARANRDYLRALYGVIKSSDAHVRFTFLTGVSKFSKVGSVSVYFWRRLPGAGARGTLVHDRTSWREAPRQLDSQRRARGEAGDGRDRGTVRRHGQAGRRQGRGRRARSSAHP